MSAATPARLALVIGAALSAAACGQSGNSSGGQAAAPPAAVSAAVAALPPPYNTGDIVHGKALFAQCRTCHTINEGGPDMTGPNLHGMFGRQIGSKPGFNYSPAVKGAGFTWDAAHLDSWIAAPRTYLPGTKMTFAGLPQEKDRIDLIAYLKTETGYKP